MSINFNAAAHFVERYGPGWAEVVTRPMLIGKNEDGSPYKGRRIQQGTPCLLRVKNLTGANTTSIECGEIVRIDPPSDEDGIGAPSDKLTYSRPSTGRPDQLSITGFAWDPLVELKSSVNMYVYFPDEPDSMFLPEFEEGPAKYMIVDVYTNHVLACGDHIDEIKHKLNTSLHARALEGNLVVFNLADGQPVKSELIITF